MLIGPTLQVLCTIRFLARLRMYAGLHIITPTRLAKARKARDDFAIMVNVSIHCMLLSCSGERSLFPNAQDLSGSVLKEFNFPKMHYLSHLLDHLWRKCASVHYNTILGEGMHVLMKATFRQTNAKEFEAQVCCIAAAVSCGTVLNSLSSQMASQFDSLTAIQRIRRTVDLYNQAMEVDCVSGSRSKRSNPHESPHLESPDRPIPIHAIENDNRYNLNSFYPRLCQFLVRLAAEDNSSFAGGQASLDSLMVSSAMQYYVLLIVIPSIFSTDFPFQAPPSTLLIVR